MKRFMLSEQIIIISAAQNSSFVFMKNENNNNNNNNNAIWNFEKKNNFKTFFEVVETTLDKKLKKLRVPFKNIPSFQHSL
jgi:hypothetical protein